MRIVLLNDDSLPSAQGGAAVMVDRLRRGLAQKGHTVTLITTHQDADRPKKETRTDDAGSIISLFTDVPNAKRHFRCLKNTDITSPVRGILHEIKPEVIHAHNLHQFLSYECLRIAKEFTNRIFLTAHDTFLVSFHRVSGEKFFRASLKGEPYAMSMLDHLHDAGRRYNPLRNSGIRKVLRETGTHVIAISHALDAFLRKNGIERARVIHNGVPVTNAPPVSLIETFRARHHLTGPTILFGGRVSEDKGIGALLAAMSSVLREEPAARLLIVGSKTAADAALRSVPENVRAATHATGWLPPEEMPVAFAAADIVTTPSLYLDAFNLMNAEAMMAGKPVIGTCFGGTAEIVEDGVTGFVLDPRNRTAFASRIVELIRHADKRAAMGAAGRARAIQEYSLNRCIEAHERLYAAESRQ